MKYVPAI